MEKSLAETMRSLTTAFLTRVSCLMAAGSVSVLWYTWAFTAAGISSNRIESIILLLIMKKEDAFVVERSASYSFSAKDAKAACYVGMDGLRRKNNCKLIGTD